jgi:hypothetical protein
MKTNVAATQRTPPTAGVPPSWGTDELSKFWDAARSNQFGTFVNKRPIYNRLVAIDCAFVEVSKRWTNPQSELAAMLLLRCHSAFRTAAGHAAAGQVVESYIMNRASLEFAAYALHIFRNPSLGMVWLNRHQDDASRKAAKRAFLHSAVKATVATVNQHAAKRFEELYQRTIDFGGHPNERSVTGSMSLASSVQPRRSNHPLWGRITRCRTCSIILQCRIARKLKTSGIGAASTMSTQSKGANRSR